MKVVRAGISGFCMGVRRAVDMANREASRQAEQYGSANRRVYTLGPLIHNPAVLENFAERGIKVLKEGEIPEDPANTTVIIRTHGIRPEAQKKLSFEGVHVLDATCPHVKANREKARLLSSRGKVIFLAGEREHAEIIGIRGYVDGPCCIVANPDEAEEEASKLKRTNNTAKTALIGQTTISTGEYDAIAAAITRYFPDLEIISSICGATFKRQNSLRELCRKVDAVIIAGGRDSANTRRLLAIAGECGVKAWLVENVEDIPPEIANYEIAGLSAGASTPDSVIDAIEEKLLSL